MSEDEKTLFQVDAVHGQSGDQGNAAMQRFEQFAQDMARGAKTNAPVEIPPFSDKEIEALRTNPDIIQNPEMARVFVELDRFHQEAKTHEARKEGEKLLLEVISEGKSDRLSDDELADFPRLGPLIKELYRVVDQLEAAHGGSSLDDSELLALLNRLRLKDDRWKDIPPSIREGMEAMVSILKKKREDLAQARAVEEAERAESRRGDPGVRQAVMEQPAIRLGKTGGSDVVGERTDSSQDLAPRKRNLFGRLVDRFSRKK